MSVVLLHGWSDVTSVVKEGGQMSIALLKRAVRGWSDVASVVTRVVRCH